MRSPDIVVTLLMVGIILAAGCIGHSREKSTDLRNNIQSGSQNISSVGNDPSSLVKPWYVKTMSINGIPRDPVRLTGIQLTFHNNGSFSGYDSCNPYTGLWQADENHIAISQINSMKLYCNEPPGVMEQESEYFALLKNASVYSVNGEDMILSDGTGKNTIFFKQVFF
jgi:heat shock protein HslJ